MKKYYFWFLLLLIPIVVFIVFACLFCCEIMCAKWLELSLSTASTISTIILGVMVYIQSEKNKESAAANRRQELLLKADSTVQINKISSFRFYHNMSTVFVTPYKNTLFIEGTKQICGKEYFQNLEFQFLFKILSTSKIDYLTIRKAYISCSKSDINGNCIVLFSSTYTPLYYEKNSIIQDIIQENDKAFATDLKIFLTEKQDLLPFILDKEVKWQLTFDYIASNRLGVCADMTADITFKISNVVDEDPCVKECKLAEIKMRTQRKTLYMRSEIKLDRKLKRCKK